MIYEFVGLPKATMICIYLLALKSNNANQMQFGMNISHYFLNNCINNICVFYCSNIFLR